MSNFHARRDGNKEWKHKEVGRCCWREKKSRERCKRKYEHTTSTPPPLKPNKNSLRHIFTLAIMVRVSPLSINANNSNSMTCVYILYAVKRGEFQTGTPFSLFPLPRLCKQQASIPRQKYHLLFQPPPAELRWWHESDPVISGCRQTLANKTKGVTDKSLTNKSLEV